MKSIYKKGALFAAAALMAFGLSGCGGDSGNASKGPKDTLTVGVTNFADSLEPTDNYFGWQVMRYGIGECLVHFDDKMNAEPWIAESWKVSDDKMSWTFKIKDIKFSNGTPVTGEAVKKSIERTFAKAPRAKAMFELDHITADGQNVTSRGSLRLKERERREENDILSFGSISFGENGCFSNHMSACFFRDFFHRFHGAAGADDVIDEENFLPADEIDIVLRKVEALLAHGRDGFILDTDGILHIGLHAFTCDDVFLHAKHTRHLMGERDALRFRGEDDIRPLGDLLRQFLCGAGDDLCIAQYDKACDGKGVGNIHDRQLARASSDMQFIVSFSHNDSFFCYLCD